MLEPYFVNNLDHSESSPGLRVTWLGHATVLVEMDGLNILTDPIFSQRASPVQFMGPKRYRGPPCTVEQVCIFFIFHYCNDFSPSQNLTQTSVSFIPLLSHVLSLPPRSCLGSMLSSLVTLIMITWMLDLCKALTNALEGSYAGACDALRDSRCAVNSQCAFDVS